MRHWRILLGELIVLALAAGCAADRPSALRPRSGLHASVDSTTGPPLRSHPKGTDVTTRRMEGRPFGIAVSRTGLVYCTLLDAANLVRMQIGSDSVGTVRVDAVPTDVAFSPAGNWAYVTNQRAHTIGVVDTRTHRQVSTIGVHGDPFRVAVGPEGQQIYATTNAGEVLQIDGGTRSISWTLQLGGNLNGLIVNPSGSRIYVGDVDGKIYELDSDGAILRTMAAAGRPQGLALAPDGAELYVAGEAGDLIVLDLARGVESARTALGGGGFGIALTPDQAQIWVSTPRQGRIVVVARSSRTIVRTIALGGTPRRLGFDREGTVAVIADEAGAIHFVR